ncbi:uncharacterized protein [Chelonus insularis]|uniref:uncharacterized protein n=1 Tax=Chelonus insularis TaxID=460826 RepID=UPI00158B53D5|nr:uncharacterized protein LOC118065323 [Chelonus insularis]
MADKRLISPAKSDYVDVAEDNESVEGISEMLEQVSVSQAPSPVPVDSQAEGIRETTLKVPEKATTSRDRSKSPPAIANTTQFKLTSQMARYQQLQFMYQDVLELVRQPALMTMSVIEGKLAQLNKLWTYFVVEHEALGVECRLTLFKHPYMTDRVFGSALRLHYHTESTLHRVKSELHEKDIQKSLDEYRLSTQQATLPEITLPTFSGDSSEWTQFRDMFTSLVHDRQDLRPVSKLHYLEANLSGPPSQLIRHAIMNDDGYELAWKQLKERYDNPEQLIFSHIKHLFSIPTPASKSAEQLDNLVGIVKQNLDALRALNVPADSADYFLIYSVASKLEQHLRESWELERSRSRSPTTLNSLLNFISTRARAMESA